MILTLKLEAAAVEVQYSELAQHLHRARQRLPRILDLRSIDYTAAAEMQPIL